MIHLFSIFRIFIFFNTLRYDMFCEKYSIKKNLITKNLFIIISIFFKFIIINVLMIFLYIFSISKIIQFKWIILAVIILFLIYYYMIPYVIYGDDQKLGFLNYLKCGIFTKSEYTNNINYIISYYVLSFLILLAILICYVNITAFRLFNIDKLLLFFILVIETVSLFIYFKLLKKKVSVHLFHTDDLRIKNSLLSVMLITMIIKFSIEKILNMHIKIDLFYFLLCITVVALSFLVVDVFFADKVIKIENNFLFNKIGVLHKDITNDFYIREINPKVRFVVILCVILKLWNGDILFKNVLFVAIMTILTSQYNQRYLLNTQFFDYSILIKDNRKILTFFIIKLYCYPVFFITYLTFIINTKYVYVLLNNFLLIVNMLLLTVIYKFQLDLKIEDYKKIKSIEALTFLLLFFELIIGFIL